MMTTPETTCALRISPRQDDHRSVAEVIAQHAGEAAPLLAWAEPDPLHVAPDKHGRRDDFKPLVQGVPSWPADLPLAEARLFWPTAALHVVAREGGGCSWTRIEEGGADGEMLLAMRTEFSVHALSDLARFGLAAHEALKGLPLRAIEYRERGRLAAWRLTIGEA